jgi:hypothetical protein
MLMHPKFQAGQYRAVAEELLEAAPATRRRYFASLVGALSFLGRLEEAEDLFALEAKKKRAVDGAAARFFLAVGFTRRSEYAKAKALFEANEKEAGSSPLARFFVHQGNVFFHFYTGRLTLCRAAAEEARRAAIAAGDPFARALATDSLGHVQVRLGQIHRGLGYLNEAERLARRVGNQSMSTAIAISRDLYAAEFGLAEDPVAALESRWQRGGPENNYSQANVGLELGRQLTLRGAYAAASAVLEKTAPLIYANQNRRHEIQLNLRLAELAGRRGALFQARHYLWFCRRLLNHEVDSSLELMALGVQAKLAAAEGKHAEEAEALQRAAQLGDQYPSARDQNLRARRSPGEAIENAEDRVHLVLKAARAGATPEARLAPLLNAGYLAEASLALGLNPASPTLAVLPGKLGLLIQREEGLSWKTGPLTSLQRKLLGLFLPHAELSKQAMVEGAWGYRYDAIRHDGMVYAALSALRRALGPAGVWIQPTENGYRFEAVLAYSGAGRALGPAQPALVTPAPAPAESALDLNHRQLEILDWLKKARFGSVRECQARFGTSEVTALRDLRGLWKRGVVVRVGKARATRYSLASGV